MIGTAGRIVPQKNHAVLLDIAEKLLLSTSQFKICIAGEGILKLQLEEEITKRNLQNHVELIGFIHPIEKFLHTIDIFVLPSIWEGFGYVIAEAMYCSKPVIAFNISSNPELIEHNKTGFLIPPYSIQEFSDKLLFFINNPQEIHKMGAMGKEIALSRFTFQISFSNFKNFLKSLD